MAIQNTTSLPGQRASTSTVRLYSLQDAASYLAISYWSVRTLIERGDIPVIRMGRRLLIDRLDLDSWILNNKETF
jgi:excisionase family DNA binding protein